MAGLLGTALYTPLTCPSGCETTGSVIGHSLPQTSETGSAHESSATQTRCQQHSTQISQLKAFIRQFTTQSREMVLT